MNPEQDKQLIINFCRDLRNKSMTAHQKENMDSPEPRLFFANSQENTDQASFFNTGKSRPLDQPVIEIILNLPALSRRA